MWFPLVSLETVTDDSLRQQLLQEVPRELFVFPERALAPGEAEPLVTGTITSESSKPEVELPKAGEPLLRVNASHSTYLAVDGTLYHVSQSALDVLRPTPPAGGSVLPQAVRMSWAPLESLLGGAATPADKKAVEKYYQRAEQTRVCLSNAKLRFSQATENVIITAKQRDAASRRFDADRSACKPEVTDKLRRGSRWWPDPAAEVTT